MGNRAGSRRGRTDRELGSAGASGLGSRGGLGATPTGHWEAGPEWHLRSGQQTDCACALAGRAGQGPRSTRRRTGAAAEAEGRLSLHSASRGDPGPYALGSRDAQNPPEALASRSDQASTHCSQGGPDSSLGHCCPWTRSEVPASGTGLGTLRHSHSHQCAQPDPVILRVTGGDVRQDPSLADEETFWPGSGHTSSRRVPQCPSETGRGLFCPFRGQPEAQTLCTGPGPRCPPPPSSPTSQSAPVLGPGGGAAEGLMGRMPPSVSAVPSAPAMVRTATSPLQRPRTPARFPFSQSHRPLGQLPVRPATMFRPVAPVL